MPLRVGDHILYSKPNTGLTNKITSSKITKKEKKTLSVAVSVCRLSTLPLKNVTNERSTDPPTKEE